MKTPAWMVSHGPPWRAGPPERIHDNPFFAIDKFDAVAPTGVETPYYMQHFKNLATGVIALHPDGTISLVGQWRFPSRAYSWELPEGGVPPEETAQEGAQRELREEAGLTAATWRPILQLELSNASSDETCVLFLATDLSPADIDPDPTEQLTVARVPFGEALSAIAAGLIRDSLTVAGLLRVHHMAVTGDLAPDLADAVLRSVRAYPPERG